MAPLLTSDMASDSDQFELSAHANLGNHSTLLLIIFAGLISIFLLLVSIIACGCCKRRSSKRVKEVHVPSSAGTSNVKPPKPASPKSFVTSQKEEPKLAEVVKSNKTEQSMGNKPKDITSRSPTPLPASSPASSPSPASSQRPDMVTEPKKGRYIEMDQDYLAHLFEKSKQQRSMKVSADNQFKYSLSTKVASDKQKLPAPASKSFLKMPSVRKQPEPRSPTPKSETRRPVPKADAVPAAHRGYRTLAVTNDNFEPSIIKKTPPTPKDPLNYSLVAADDLRYRSLAGLDDVFGPNTMTKTKTSKSDQ